jgi:hypothetical protein
MSESGEQTVLRGKTGQIEVPSDALSIQRPNNNDRYAMWGCHCAKTVKWISWHNCVRLGNIVIRHAACMTRDRKGKYRLNTPWRMPMTVFRNFSAYSNPRSSPRYIHIESFNTWHAEAYQMGCMR